MRGVVHAAVPAEELTAQVRATVRDIDPALPVYSVDSVDRLLSASLAPQRNSMTLLSLLSVVALVMAAVGVFGVLSFAVSRRTREIGIRMALGADARSVRRIVIRDGMTPVVIGLAVGLLTAIGATRFMEALLFNVSPTDPLTLVGATVILIGAALLAVYLPARRATRVDPVKALGAE
jgi:ABC-type antimicrobial peptide transport system permease subunit